jgi:hypothetical protein
MIPILLRNPTSYFRTYRNYFVAIYAAFFAFPVRELTLLFYPDEILLHATTQLLVAAAIVIAVLWGHLATRLYLYPEPLSLRFLVSGPGRPIRYLFLLYLVPMEVELTASLAVPGAFDSTSGNQATYIFSQATYQVVGYSSAFLEISLWVVVAFVGYPLLVLVRLRSQLRDEKVRHALRIIASCFGIISALILLVNAIATFGVSLIGIGHLVSVGLLIVVVNAFRKPSFLKSFLGVVPSLEKIPTGRKSDRSVLIYTDEEEKFGPISKFVSEGVSQQGRVIYFYRNDEAALREGLARSGINVRQHITKGDLHLTPLSSLYQSEGMMDEEAAIDYCQELIREARALGKESLRLIVDYGDHAKRPSYKFVEHLVDTRWTAVDHYVHVLMTFAKSAFQGQEQALELLKSRVPVLDLSEAIDAFSRTVGLSHSEVAGKKILLEYDPQSDYEKILKSLLAESASNFERIIIFTRVDSPSHSLAGDEPGLKMFILTSRVSYPKMEGDNQVLLPAYDTSLLLDALNRTIEAFAGASFTVIFDNISHYIFTLGPDRTQSLVRQSLELMISDKITAVFLLNLGAHDEKTISTFENFFDLELVSRPGARFPEVRKRLSVTAR